jgi:hypothetical protein
MTTKLGISEWAKIAEIAGGIAIIASLIFVGYELRQASQQLRLSSDIDADMTNAGLSIRIAESPELSDLVYRGEQKPETLSDEQMHRFANIALPRLAMWENTYDSYLLGNVSEEDWLAWDIFLRLRFNKPGYRYVYEKYRAGFGKRSLNYFAEVFGLDDSSESESAGK